jgi:hypothetical protein
VYRKVTCLLIALLVTSISGCVDKKTDSQIQWSTYEDQQGKFSVEYPKDWKVEAKTVGKTYILIFEKSRTTALEISSRELPSTFQDLELTYFLDELAERAKSSPISEPEKLQIGGYDAMKRKYKAEVWGTSMTTTVAVTKLNKSVYLFALHSLSSEFSQNEQIFNHMISSFRSPAVEPKLSGIQATKSQPTTLSVIEKKRLTTHTAIDDYPAWSPDGKKIVFTSDRSGNFDIWVMDADGSSQKQLTINQELDSHPAWSPDGKNIAFWSERLGNRDIWVMDDEGGNQKQLTVNPSYDYAPSWSPDGTKIAFVSNRSGNFDIWVMGVNGQNEAQLTTDVEDDYVYPQSWSPDRKKIVFTSYRSGNGDIWVMDNDGGNKKQLTKDTAWDGRPAWSPDGKRIAFSSYRSGNNDIWVMDTDGSNQKQLVASQDSDNNPSWSPDGKKIVYVLCKDSGCDIWIATLTEIPFEPSLPSMQTPAASPTKISAPIKAKGPILVVERDIDAPTGGYVKEIYSYNRGMQTGVKSYYTPPGEYIVNKGESGEVEIEAKIVFKGKVYDTLSKKFYVEKGKKYTLTASSYVNPNDPSGDEAILKVTSSSGIDIERVIGKVSYEKPLLSARIDNITLSEKR